MSCPTCGHTMQNMGGAFFWCPRCGTVKERWGPGTRTLEQAVEVDDAAALYVPDLVQRCRDFASLMHLIEAHETTRSIIGYWQSRGIEESIGPPKG